VDFTNESLSDMAVCLTRFFLFSTETIQSSLAFPGVCSEEERTSGVRVKAHPIVNEL
jgi:hypothetical protein